MINRNKTVSILKNWDRLSAAMCSTCRESETLMAQNRSI